MEVGLGCEHEYKYEHDSGDSDGIDYDVCQQCRGGGNSSNGTLFGGNLTCEACGGSGVAKKADA